MVEELKGYLYEVRIPIRNIWNLSLEDIKKHNPDWEAWKVLITLEDSVYTTGYIISSKKLTTLVNEAIDKEKEITLSLITELGFIDCWWEDYFEVISIEPDQQVKVRKTTVQNEVVNVLKEEWCV